MFHHLNILNSTLASTKRGWRGSMAKPYGVHPDKDLILYDREGCPRCRLVREALTELDLDAVVYPCPEGGTRYRDQLQQDSGQTEVPFLLDPNTGEKLEGLEAILEYLFQQYKQRTVPSALKATAANLEQSKAASQLRKFSGTKASPSKSATELMTLYSFESSPYTRPVRELMCELELAYKVINLGKNQRADIGPAKLHFSVGPYKPLPNTKRATFYAEHGNVQVPYLIDPNTGTAMFESKDILKYLKKTYAA